MLDTTDDLIVSARTASGKTEAAFLPILSQLVAEPKGSVRALYLSPLRALINDQFRRLETLCKRSEIPVHRRHKDVGQADRDKLFRDPGGVLAITPESIEALLLNRSAQMSALVRGLRYVVIDELHAFAGRERGVHLRSLLNRLFRYAESAPRIVALSATLGDSYDVYRRWIRPDRPESVAIVEDVPSQRDVDLAIKAFEITAEDEAENSKKRRSYEFSGDLVADVMAKFAGEKNLFFANRKDALESLADVLNEHCEHDRRPPEFLAHHGSLSKEARERAEQRMHGDKPPRTACVRATSFHSVTNGNSGSPGPEHEPNGHSSPRRDEQESTRPILESRSISIVLRDDCASSRRTSFATRRPPSNWRPNCRANS